MPILIAIARAIVECGCRRCCSHEGQRMRSALSFPSAQYSPVRTEHRSKSKQTRTVVDWSGCRPRVLVGAVRPTPTVRPPADHSMPLAPPACRRQRRCKRSAAWTGSVTAATPAAPLAGAARLLRRMATRCRTCTSRGATHRLSAHTGARAPAVRVHYSRAQQPASQHAPCDAR